MNIIVDTVMVIPNLTIFFKSFDLARPICPNIWASGYAKDVICELASAITNPFAIVVAQRLSEAPILSGMWLRAIVFICIRQKVKKCSKMVYNCDYYNDYYNNYYNNKQLVY